MCCRKGLCEERRKRDRERRREGLYGPLYLFGKYWLTTMFLRVEQKTYDLLLKVAHVKFVTSDSQYVILKIYILGVRCQLIAAPGATRDVLISHKKVR